MDSYADHPRSIGELRSERSRDAADWSPRDALIDALRRLDAGEMDPDALVICVRDRLDEGRIRTLFSISASDSHTAVGLLERVKFLVLGS